MEWLQTLLDGGTAPVLTALILGLMTAISPCPLATNIAAMGYIARDMGEPRISLSRGYLYCIGRFYNRMTSVQKWMNLAVGILFIGIGI